MKLLNSHNTMVTTTKLQLQPSQTKGNTSRKVAYMPLLTHEVLNQHNIEKKPTFHIPTHIHSYQEKEVSYLMSPKLFSLYSLVERRKPQDSRVTDELALVKAAAWAWYQHGASSEGKAMSEFGVTRAQRAPRPSRFKLEAMRMAKEEAKEGPPNAHTNKSLLDTYEVQSISSQLDRLIECSHNKLVNGNNSANNGNRRMNKKRIIKGFWPRNALVCGGGNDVVDGSALTGGRLSVKRVPVVKSG